MKTRDWIFVGIAAAAVVAIWWFFFRKGAPASADALATTKASEGQSKEIGSSQVVRDAFGRAYPIY